MNNGCPSPENVFTPRIWMLTLLPGSADSDVIVHVRRLARECRGEIRLVGLRDFLAADVVDRRAELFIRGDRAFARDDELLQHDRLRLEREVGVDRARAQRHGHGLRLEALQANGQQCRLTRRACSGNGEAIRTVRFRLRAERHLSRNTCAPSTGAPATLVTLPVSSASPCARATCGAAARASTASTDRTRNLMRPPLVDCFDPAHTMARTMEHLLAPPGWTVGC